MIRAAVFGALLLASGALGARAQIAIHVVDSGPALAARIVASAVTGPHDVVGPDSTPAVLTREREHPRSVVVVARDVVVEGRVDGDVTAIGGNIIMHPGGSIAGRAVAIGGGVYESSLARIGGGAEEFRDFTYDAARVPDGVALSYRALRADDVAVAQPIGVGFSTPTYDRSNGISLGLGPDVQLARWSTSIEARITYRSQLGAWDPSFTATHRLGARTSLRLDARRGTFSNDDWIWPDLVNSFETLLLGEDSRNYYRGTRERASMDWKIDRATAVLKPYVAFAHEHTGSVRPAYAAADGPWSLIGRHGRNDMLRPNFQVLPAHLYSAHAGLQLDWSTQGIASHASLDQEVGRSSPDCIACSAVAHGAFAQTTVDGFITFPTFGTQSLRFDVHGVMTSHGIPPERRMVFLGGPGTLPTEPMLEHGGNELLFVDARYEIPVPRVSVPIVGPPTLALRTALGGVTVNQFPSLTQLVGVRLAAGFIYGEVLMEPATRHAHGDIGITIGR